MSASSTKLVAYDLETTMRCKREGFSSSTPWDTSNEILCGALAYRSDPSIITTRWFHGNTAVPANSIGFPLDLHDSTIVCGHNLKFDLIYTMTRRTELYTDWLHNVPLWDTMIAEYLLTAQTTQYASLKELCEKYEVTNPKSDFLEQVIANGHTTEDCAIVDLVDYCMLDCKATLEVAEKQMQRALTKHGPKMIQLILMHSNVTRVLAEMEVNGMTLDMARLSDAAIKTAMKLDALRDRLAEQVWNQAKSVNSEQDLLALTSNIKDYANSNPFWSAFFFGGEYKLPKRTQVGEYKSGAKKGEPRFSVSEITLKFNRIFDPATVGSMRTKTGAWSLDETVLRNMLPATEILLEYRKYQKLQSTYLVNLPTKAWNGVVHPQINQTSTMTGRLSQTNPNLQNQSSEPIIKNLFVTSSEDLAFIEADYKQLEMVFFAMLTQDPTLCSDLRALMDVHTIIGKQLYGSIFGETLRRKVKGVNFGMIYGGGAKTLSKQVGLPEESVKKIMGNFFKRYETIKPFRQARTAALMKSTDRFKVGEKHYVRDLSPTGRSYAYELQKKVTFGGVSMEPSYTAMCNYPVQGMATGDAVPMMLLYIWERIREAQLPIIMCNTVHDSILFQVPKCEVARLGLWIKEELEKMPQRLTELFGIDTLDLPMNVVVKSSKDSWAGPWTEIYPF